MLRNLFNTNTNFRLMLLMICKNTQDQLLNTMYTFFSLQHTDDLTSQQCTKAFYRFMCIWMGMISEGDTTVDSMTETFRRKHDALDSYFSVYLMMSSLCHMSRDVDKDVETENTRYRIDGSKHATQMYS